MVENTIQVSHSVQGDPWQELKSFTKARIALGRSGTAIPVKEVLALKAAHADAKDAINTTMDVEELTAQFEPFQLPVYSAKSQVENRDHYLKRPDLGKRLDEHSINLLKDSPQSFDLLIILADGLSAEAVNSHAIPVLELLLPSLSKEYRVAIVLVEQGRVAIGDEISALLHAKFSAVLIGERPGLSSPNSLGIYTTFQPSVGLTDERRNCISNIHENGLSYPHAVKILQYLIHESFRRKISGVDLKLEIGKIIES